MNSASVLPLSTCQKKSFEFSNPVRVFYLGLRGKCLGNETDALLHILYSQQFYNPIHLVQ